MTLRLIGVLGGMGPAATVDFMAKVMAATPARTDQEHVPLIVHDVPQIPDRVAPIFSHTDQPLEPMKAGLRILENAGVAAIAIACVTAHHWYEPMAASIRVPLLHIADATAAKLARVGAPRKLGLLATRGTVASGFFPKRLAPHGYELLIAGEAAQSHLDRAIAAVKRGELAVAVEAAEAAGAALEQGGVTEFLLACTELPIAFAASRYAARCHDSTIALAEACVAFSRG